MFDYELDEFAGRLDDKSRINRAKGTPIEDDYSEDSDGGLPTDSEPPEPISWTSGR